MGRITLGDVLLAGLVVLLLVFAVMGASALVLYIGLGFSPGEYFVAFMITVLVFLLVGGILTGVRSHRAGYPVFRTWTMGAGAILAAFVVLAAIGGWFVSVDVIPWLALTVTLFLLGLLFAVGLAAFLNARYSGVPTQRTFGTRPATWGASIYKSSQPAIYEGIMELDLDEKAPGSLYRRRQ